MIKKSRQKPLGKILRDAVVQKKSPYLFRSGRNRIYLYARVIYRRREYSTKDRGENTDEDDHKVIQENEFGSADRERGVFKSKNPHQHIKANDNRNKSGLGIGSKVGKANRTSLRARCRTRTETGTQSGTLFVTPIGTLTLTDTRTLIRTRIRTL